MTTVPSSPLRIAIAGMVAMAVAMAVGEALRQTGSAIQADAGLKERQ